MLGIASEVIRLRREGKTYGEIATIFELEQKTISRFFKYYEGLKPAQRTKLAKKSVFDVTARLEELMTVLHSDLHRLRGADDESYVKILSEVRQVLTLATKITEKVNSHKEWQNFQAVVRKILLEFVPQEHQQAVINRIYNLSKLNTVSTETEDLFR
jgi:hypothetical protein